MNPVELYDITDKKRLSQIEAGDWIPVGVAQFVGYMAISRFKCISTNEEKVMQIIGLPRPPQIKRDTSFI